VESGSLAELRHLTRTSVSAELRQPAEGIRALPGVHDVVVDGARVSCEVDAGALDALLQAMGRAGIVSLTSQPPTLEQLFLRHYAGPAAP